MDQKPIHSEQTAQGTYGVGSPASPPMGQQPPPPGPQPYVLPTIQPTPVLIQPKIGSYQPTVKIGSQPNRVTCPQCQNSVITRVEYRPGTITHICAVGLVLVGCCFCACLPYCIKSCQTAHHYCPNCEVFIGDYRAW